MAHYSAPIRETLFILDEVIGLSGFGRIPGYDLLTDDVLATIVTEAGRFAAEIVAPLRPVGDRQGCTHHPDGRVALPDGYTDAYRRFHEAGWGSLALPTKYGGQGLPALLAFVLNEYICSANLSFWMSAGAPAATFKLLDVAASQALKDLFLPRLARGEWSGCMDLTEPHCGSDVGLLRTRADPMADGTYRISGTKIFISGGEHDAVSNIVHLVLARIAGAPSGTKGISLFLVPKFLVAHDGSLGQRNAVSCGAIEHKMGLRGSPTCVINFDGAIGQLVGHENQGLAAMFILMNAARISVGIQALAIAEASYQGGASYAVFRRQGRAPAGPAEPAELADRIIEHPDVRRMLMNARAFTEAIRALTLWCGLLVDLAERSDQENERQEAENLLALLTPILKGYGADRGLQVAIDMQQIWGGHGYVVENGMEQYVRDGRIAMIYEGATGIQAGDLVRRKLLMAGGAVVRSLFATIDQECVSARENPALRPLADRLAAAADDMDAATSWLRDQSDVQASASSFYFLEMAGIVVLGLMWLRIAVAATCALSKEQPDQSFYREKLQLADYYSVHFLPDTVTLRQKVETGSATLMALSVDGFGSA